MSSLDDRYGRRRPLRRVWWWMAGGAGVAVILGWIVWVNFAFASIETEDIGQSYNAERREMTVSWNVTATPGTRLACALQALNQEFQVVGWKVVDIPASNEHTRQFTEALRTTTEPTTAFAYSCWAS